MKELSLTEISKYISLILRHKPEVIGITLDEHGWANVDELIQISETEYQFRMPFHDVYLDARLENGME